MTDHAHVAVVLEALASMHICEEHTRLIVADGGDVPFHPLVLEAVSSDWIRVFVTYSEYMTIIPSGLIMMHHRFQDVQAAVSFAYSGTVQLQSGATLPGVMGFARELGMTTLIDALSEMQANINLPQDFPDAQVMVHPVLEETQQHQHERVFSAPNSSSSMDVTTTMTGIPPSWTVMVLDNFGQALTSGIRQASSSEPATTAEITDEVGTSSTASNNADAYDTLKQVADESLSKTKDQSSPSHELNPGDKQSGRYVCDACGTRFKSKKVLENHVQRMHLLPDSKTELQPKSCPLCFANFGSSSYSLTLHMNLEHQNQALICWFCKQEFISKNRLLWHQRTSLSCNLKNLPKNAEIDKLQSGQDQISSDEDL